MPVSKPVVKLEKYWHRLHSERSVTFEVLALATRWASEFEKRHGPVMSRDFEDLWLTLDGITLRSGKRLDVPMGNCPAKRFIMNDIKGRM